MRVSLRPVTDADVAECGRICYEAFAAIATEHRFPVDLSTEEMAARVIAARLAHRLTYGVVAEVDGRIAGSAFLKVHRPVGAIGPVTVAPRFQGGQVGRLLMEHLMEQARAAGLGGTRLVQAAYNMESLALYTKLGFQMRELLACLYGKPLTARLRGRGVRAGRETDLDACNRLCQRLQGYPRSDDLLEAMRARTLSVVLLEGQIRGYSTGLHFRGHTVTETNEDAKALIAAAEDLPDPGMLVPARNGELLRWLMENGMRITQPLSLMTQGFYREPEGAFLSSIHG